MVDKTTPQNRLTEGIEALGIESSVARAIAELTCDVQFKRVMAGFCWRIDEDRFQAGCWELLFQLLNKLAAEDADWSAWAQAHAETSRMVREAAVAKYRANH
jgi:hypothetical protein